MADWFKFYNDGLDSAGMQYCLSEQPSSVSVWLLILSEASKNRSGTLHWDASDYRLLGFARKLNISPGIFNQSLNLLQKAGYIALAKTTLTIPGWEKMQSDYAKGIDRGYYKHTSKTLASDSLVSTVRGEERRGEENPQRTTKLPASVKSGWGKRRTQMTARFHAALNSEWENDRQKWMGRIKRSVEKCERVLADLESAQREGAVKTSPAAYAEDTWKRFSPHD